MAENDEHDDGPSLKMPSLSLRRRRRTSEPVEPVEPAEPAAGPTEPDAPTSGRRPSLGGLPAAVLTGLAVGALAVLLAWLAGAGCSAVRGTSSCGGAIGLPLLLGGLVLLAWTGSLLLRLFGVADAGSTSLLAVGILAVLVMVLLLGSLDEWWSAVAVPLLAAGAYAGSWWVTTSVVGDDTAAVDRTPHDVR